MFGSNNIHQSIQRFQQFQGEIEQHKIGVKSLGRLDQVLNQDISRACQEAKRVIIEKTDKAAAYALRELAQTLRVFKASFSENIREDEVSETFQIMRSLSSQMNRLNLLIDATDLTAKVLDPEIEIEERPFPFEATDLTNVYDALSEDVISGYSLEDCNSDHGFELINKTPKRMDSFSEGELVERPQISPDMSDLEIIEPRQMNESDGELVEPDSSFTPEEIQKVISESSRVRHSAIGTFKNDMLNLPSNVITSPLSQKVTAIPTEHSADTVFWRKELIKSAKHNIVLSGNYCGGKSFDEFLELIETQMEEQQELKVVIISSPNFIKNEIDKKNKEQFSVQNKRKIEILSERYPQRFSIVESPDTWYGFKKSTNHTKCLVVDYGKYFILGGSGVKDNFAKTGQDDLTVEAFSLQREYQKSMASMPQAMRPIPLANPFEVDLQYEEKIQEVVPKRMMPFKPAASSLIEEEDQVDNGLLGMFIPGNFRDMDFVFGIENQNPLAGELVYQEMLLLAHRWEKHSLAETRASQFDAEALDRNTIPALDRNAEQLPVTSEDSVTDALLKTHSPELAEIDTQVPFLDFNEKSAHDVAMKVFFSGPEHSHSAFSNELIHSFENAQKEIIIDHMYFQPTQEVMDALIEAGKRGVKIKIVTAGIYKDCPNSQLFFGPRNKYNYAYLISSLPPQFKENVEVYEYQQKKKGNHKKVVVVDNTVIAGSSNMGYKSLALTGDHEINFLAESPEFAEQTRAVIYEDIKRSLQVERPEEITVRDRIMAIIHSTGARIWG